MITARNDSALSAKQTASLTIASRRPASAGPMILAELTSMELSATTLERSARSSTRFTQSLWRNGHVECVHDAEPQRQHDKVPHGDVTRPRENRENERLQEAQRLGDAQGLRGWTWSATTPANVHSARIPALVQNATTPSSQTEPEMR
jgi:hypothetical protein